MNIIERNKENDTYRPRTICTGYTVTALRARSHASVIIQNTGTEKIIEKQPRKIIFAV
jgi:hypothetical protein